MSLQGDPLKHVSDHRDGERTVGLGGGSFQEQFVVRGVLGGSAVQGPAARVRGQVRRGVGGGDDAGENAGVGRVLTRCWG